MVTYKVPSHRSEKGRQWKPEVVDEDKRKNLWEKLSLEEQYHIRTKICGYSTNIPKLPSNQLGLGSNNAALISFSGSHEDSNEDDSIQDVSVITPVPRRTTTPQRKKAAFYGGMLDKFDQRL